MPPAIPVADAEIEEWPVPRQTGNAHLLCGYIGGLLNADAEERGGSYRVGQLGNPLIVLHKNGNRYRVTAEQISGEE